MSSSLKNIALLALATGLVSVSSAATSGSGKTTRYWYAILQMIALIYMLKLLKGLLQGLLLLARQGRCFEPCGHLRQERLSALRLQHRLCLQWWRCSHVL